ncbi:MAG TPA: PASTA domain-containing protein [Chloroflexota bacterium]|nr:PASTA domain-containing protein [Chloroflexota bacterium]
MTSLSTAPEVVLEQSLSEERAAELLIGGRYRLERIVDEDELRLRCLATDVWLHREVLVEVLNPSTRFGGSREERILRRLGRIAQMRFPGIPRLLDGGLDEQIGPFIVFQPVTAPTLRSVQRSSDRLVGAQISDCAISIGRSLQAAHDRGLVHGRICPGNIHYDRLSGRTCLVGWLDGAAPRKTAAALSSMQAPGSAYLPPENLHDELIGPAADVHGLGVLVYELFTGLRPASGSIRARHPSIPRPLQPVLERALEPDPRRRWSSMADFVAAIEKSAPAAARQTPAGRARTSAPSLPQPLESLRWSRNWAMGAYASSLALIATLLAFVMITLFMLHMSGEVPFIGRGVALNVPSVLGKTVPEAQQVAGQQEMQLQVIGSRESDRYAAGRIMQQSPVAGWHPFETQPIRVTVSSGVLAPNLVGKSFVDAAKQANDLGWKIARVDTTPRKEAQAAATVLVQSPAPDVLLDAPGELALVITE